MLPQQSRLFAAGADVLDAKWLARDHGQAKSRPQDLAAAFADGAVELDGPRFHVGLTPRVVPSRTSLPNITAMTQTGRHGPGGFHSLENSSLAPIANIAGSRNARMPKITSANKGTDASFAVRLNAPH